MLKIYDLKTEYLSLPNAVDNPRPRFSWKILSDSFNIFQKSYRIIASSNGEVIWDSGIVESDSQLAEYNGLPLKSRQMINWQVAVVCITDDGEQSAVSERASFSMGLLNEDDWKAKWIEAEGEIDPYARKPVPYLRKAFVIKKPVKRAVIYQTAQGLYEFFINGKCPTQDKFKPGFTSYYYRLQYHVCDITSHLREGTNVWAVILADGWWRGVTGGTVINNFGRKLACFGQIEIEYEDGSTETIITDESFKTFFGGLLAADMLMGEIFDANREPYGWKGPDFDDSGWNNVHGATERHNAKLIATRSVPVREKETFEGREFRDSKGNRVLDFSQNLAGYVKFILRNTKKGQKVTLTFGECLKDGEFYIGNIDKTSYKHNAFQQITYVCGGGAEERYCPNFCVFGFRYVRIEGYEGDIQPGDFVSVAVYSDLEVTGEFSCSNPLINKLVENTLWSQKSNFLDVATDCPTRERNAWTGDAQVFVKTAAYLMNVYPFFEKWLQDQAIEQYESGKVGITFPSTSSAHDPRTLGKMKEINPLFELAGPSGNGHLGEDSAGWGDSAVWIPYVLYLFYGDKQIIINQYETAKRYVEYQLACARETNPLYSNKRYYREATFGEPDSNYIYDTRFHFGEWNEWSEHDGRNGISENDYDSNKIIEFIKTKAKVGDPIVATAYLCRSTQNLAEMAKALGEWEDYQKYSSISEKIKVIYDKHLINEDGVIQRGRQAPYVRALAMDLCCEEKRPKVLAQLIREIEENGCRLNTGFLSTPFLLSVLADNGFEDMAFKILQQEKKPGWLYSNIKGATTIPEKWDGVDLLDSSLNHCSYGAVCEFLFGYIGGIRPVLENPGFKHFVVSPVLGDLQYACAKFVSPFGPIISRWKKVDGKAKFHFEIPPNTTADVILPDGRRYTFSSGVYDL